MLIPALDATTDGFGAIRLERRRIAPAPARPGVLCVVEPALASFEAVRHAAALAGGGPLALVAPRLPLDRSADTHLTAARFIAARAGAEATVLDLAGVEPVAELLAAARDYDMLVVIDRRDDGSPGRLAGEAVRRAACPVLVSRRLPHGICLGDAVAVVAGDSSAARTGRTLARRLAAPARVPVRLAAPDRTAGGDDVLGAARRAGATLLVMPDSDLAVAARVARRAPCPVLVARAAAPSRAPRCAPAPLVGVGM
jgi:nucleotide-binding universal stress UspA family protein